MAEVGGYVLAGGASSRMGTDKALSELDGKPLIEHAVRKLREICTEVHILSSNAELAQYGPLVPDLRRGCGPLAGIEAALTHSRGDWNLLLPVDLPFLPVHYLRRWLERITADSSARVAYCEVEGKPHPALLLIRREMRSQITAALERGEHKLLTALEAAVGDTGPRVESLAGPDAQCWFANLNTPADLELARRMARHGFSPGAS
jgi:molybdopterin-guanine dinucleotide biosynthesis protein A